MGHFAKTVRLLKELQPSILVECLGLSISPAHDGTLYHASDVRFRRLRS